MATTTVSSADVATPLILTLDVGSSSTRASLFDARGRSVAGCAAHEHSALRVSAEGAVEDGAEEALARAARCIDAALAQAGPLAHHIRAVAVATMATTIVGLDTAGRPLTPLRTYADTRAAADAERLRAALDEAAAHDRTGALLRASYWPAQLASLRRTQPDQWREVRRWATLGEYLERRLFGHGRVSLSAAAWTGLLNRHTLHWDEPLCAALGLEPGLLAPLADVDEPLAGLQEPWASRWPALRGVPWLPAVGDGAAANIGSGCAGPGRLALTVGTTGALRVVRPDPVVVPPGLWCYRVDREHALVGGATSEGGNVYAWLRQTLQLGEPAATEAALAALPPDGHGLTVLPFVAGERSPGWAGDVPASIHGMTLATTPLAILRASLEEEIRLTKRAYGWPEESQFFIPEDVREHFQAQLGRRGSELRRAWHGRHEAYWREHPELASQLDLLLRGRLPDGWDAEFPTFPTDAKGLAGRDASGKVLNAMAGRHDPAWLPQVPQADDLAVLAC